MVLNKDSLFSLTEQNIDCFKSLFTENRKIITHLLKVNEEILANFFKNLDY